MLNCCRVVGPGCRQLACGLTYTPLVEQRLEVLIVGGIDDHRYVFGVASHLAAQRRHGKIGREYPICILHHAVDALQEFVYLLLTEVSRSLRSGQHGGLDSQFPILVDEQAVSLSLPAGLPDDDDQHDEEHKDQCSKEDDGPCLSTDLGGEFTYSAVGDATLRLQQPVAGLRQPLFGESFVQESGTLLKVLRVLIIILLFTYFLQPFETDCGIVSDITSARYRLSEKTQNRRLLF